MKRELILLCHGKADTTTREENHQLPLRDSSKRKAQLLGSWLQQRELIPDHILSSPTKAALHTAEYACNVMGLGIDTIISDERIFKADIKVLLMLLSNCPADTNRILLVGHNPALEKLLYLLSENKIKPQKDGKILSPASLAVLRIGKDWSKLNAGKASIMTITRSENLPKKFPFTNQDNILEWRDRPAYYYFQSAVIPYRVHAGRVEILIITSSRNKRWIIPKGVIDIGMSPQASAEKEAYEEAGVLGRVRNELLGTYQYDKWGADCNVKVYAMEVLEVISEEERLEPMRQRVWITPEEAPIYLKQKALLSIISRLNESLMLNARM